ncbi:hypothetical protein BKA70DRAFT_1087201, partial [Coprinopsis sp. MPI-PUGE-AT-0042]
DNAIYSHGVSRLPKLTNLDGRSGRVVRTVGSGANVAVLNPSYPSSMNDRDVCPIRFARVEGIFHANITPRASTGNGGSTASCPQRVEFLWVRWLIAKGPSMGALGLELLSLPPLSETTSYGFIDPEWVARDCHLVPKFSK